MAACRKPYAPPVIANNTNYLVVEGLINSGPDSTFFKLSRTVKLSSTTTQAPELNAIVTIESNQGSTYTLQETGNGEYSSPPLNLDNTRQYRIRIKTTANEEYLSDFVVAKTTPGIDSISYKVQNDGVQFYVNSHDPQNNTRYYRWDFDETWRYTSLYQSYFKLENNYPVYRTNFLQAPDDIHDCYKTAQSQQVLLGSSAKLSQDVISMYPIDFISAASGKIASGYSILLRQYALTPDAYSYWQILKTNTEQLGTIFDAQPSQLQGNIHCVTVPSEPVIGFVSVSSITSKRIYIDHNDINLFVLDYFPPPDADVCPLVAIKVEPVTTFQYRLDQAVGTGDSILVEAEQPPGAPAIIAYTYAPANCVDCRLKIPNGTNAKPVYWPNN